MKTGAFKILGTKIPNFRVFVDYVNQRLYYYGKASDHIYSMDYNGRSLKPILMNEENNGAIAVFVYLYCQKKNKPILEERNVSTGQINRNISLPTPFSFLNDLTIVLKSQHSKGKEFTIHWLISKIP